MFDPVDTYFLALFAFSCKLVLKALLDGILVSFGAKVAPQRELLGIILDTIW